MQEEVRFNPDTYMVIDRITGEEVPTKMFVKEIEKGQWEKAYTHLLADYIEAPGDHSCRILAYLLKKNL